MSQGRGDFCALVENLWWASIDVSIKCLQSLIDLLGRLGQHRYDDQELMWPNTVSDALQPVREQGLDTKPVVRVILPTTARVEAEASLVGRAWRFYAMVVGRCLGIYATWHDTVKQVISYGGNIH